MDSKILTHIAEKINEELDKSTQSLGEGKAQDYGDYKWRCGIIRGYLLAKGLIAEVAYKEEHDKDE
jgi:hypothetical protein